MHGVACFPPLYLKFTTNLNFKYLVVPLSCASSDGAIISVMKVLPWIRKLHWLLTLTTPR